jgi:cytochrome c oxidase subunit 2
LNAPALAGQSLSYLNRQITKFRQGSRGGNQADSTGQQMANIAATLNDADSLLAVNQYISNLIFQAEINSAPPVSSTQHLADDSRKFAMQLKQGSNYYQGKCGACHGGNGEGNEKMFAPRLNNLSTSYLLKQMKNFSDGSRGAQSDDKYGRQMAMMAKTSSGQELKNIIMYINKIGLKASTGEHRE